MFNFHSVNTAEVNAGSVAPSWDLSSIDADLVVDIQAGEDSNALTWPSPYFTDFFKIYWSDQPFTSITDPGVHEIDSRTDESSFVPGIEPPVIISYDHTIPAAFGLSVLYYRIYAFNENGGTLSDQLDSYNFRLAIYQEIYNKTLEDVTLRFTPEIRTQYQDSILWRSFVQSLCSELAQSRFMIKEAIKQMNLQKAVNVFLNAWNNITGISKINNVDPDTGELVLETDEQYRQRIIDSVFWDKISNLALKKTLLLKLGYDADVIDEGLDPTDFRTVPGTESNPVYSAEYGASFMPGEIVHFLFVGPNGYATVVSDDGTTLNYSGYTDPGGAPFGEPYSYFGGTSWMFATPTASPVGNPNGSGTHEALVNPFDSIAFNVGDAITFTGILGNYSEGIVTQASSSILKFNLTSGFPQQYDLVQCPLTGARSVLTSEVTVPTALGQSINAKLLSNIYSVNLGLTNLDDEAMNDVYDEISPLAALGNVLTKILNDVAASFNDWDTDLGNIPYGPIFMGASTYSGSKSTELNWSIAEELYLDNQWTMGDAKLFYGNDGPDDIVILTRTV